MKPKQMICWLGWILLAVALFYGVSAARFPFMAIGLRVPPNELTIRRTENAIYRWENKTILMDDLNSKPLGDLKRDFSDGSRQDLMDELEKECQPWELQNRMTYQDIKKEMTVYDLIEKVHGSLR